MPCLIKPQRCPACGRVHDFLVHEESVEKGVDYHVECHDASPQEWSALRVIRGHRGRPVGRDAVPLDTAHVPGVARRKPG